MNKLIFLFFLSFTLTCNNKFKNKIKLILLDSSEQVILVSSNGGMNYVTRVLFPKKIEISNESNYNLDFVKISYIYNNIPIERNLGIGLFTNKENQLTPISPTGKKSISSKQKFSYLLFTRHFIDTSKTSQQQLKPYITEMLTKNKDTIHIGSISEFKQKHSELFEKLTKNDSISIHFLDNGKLGERITVPVEW